MPSPPNFDAILRGWPYKFGEVAARRTAGEDGRQVLLLRVDLGVLQMEVAGRPDGERPEGFDTVYDLLLAKSHREGDGFELTGEDCAAVDREFVQFYHRRVAWLALRAFREAVADADHTLALMDLSSSFAPSQDWADLHEQYRPFVLFHRTQAAALAELEEGRPEAAVEALDEGVALLERSLAELEDDEEDDDDDPSDHEAFAAGGEAAGRHPAEAFGESGLDAADGDEFLAKLRELRASIVAEYELVGSLAEQLAEAVAREQYELAAELRDRIAQRPRQGSRRGRD